MLCLLASSRNGEGVVQIGVKKNNFLMLRRQIVFYVHTCTTLTLRPLELLYSLAMHYFYFKGVLYRLHNPGFFFSVPLLSLHVSMYLTPAWMSTVIVDFIPW